MNSGVGGFRTRDDFGRRKRPSGAARGRESRRLGQALFRLDRALDGAFGRLPARSRCFGCRPGSIPRWRFPRISIIARSQGLAVQDVEIAVTRPIEDAVGIVPGVSRVQSKSVRGAADNQRRLHRRGRHGAGPQRRPRQNGRGRFAIPRRNLDDRRAADTLDLPDHFLRRHRRARSGGVVRLRTFLIFARGSAASAMSSYVTVQGGDLREVVVEVDPDRLLASHLSIADVADRLAKEHRLKAVGRMDRGLLQYQVLADTQVKDPLDLENVVVAAPNNQPIRVADLGRVIVSHQDRTMANPRQRARRGGADRLSAFGGQRPDRVAGSGNGAGRREEIGPAGDQNQPGVRPGKSGPYGHRQLCATRSSSAAHLASWCSWRS